MCFGRVARASVATPIDFLNAADARARREAHGVTDRMGGPGTAASLATPVDFLNAADARARREAHGGTDRVGGPSTAPPESHAVHVSAPV